MFSYVKKFIYLRSSLTEMLWSSAFVLGRMHDFPMRFLVLFFSAILNILMYQFVKAAINTWPLM